MDVRQMEYLLAIAREGSISAAAEVIHISQPALSQNLQKIEKQLGVPLFDRIDRKMIPTEVGKIYLNGAKELVRIKNDTFSRIDELVHQKKNLLSISVSPQIYQHSGQRVLDKLQEICEGNVVFQELSSDIAREYLVNDFLDCAVICHNGKPDSALTIHRLCTEETVLAVPEDLAWEGTTVDPVYLKKCPFAVIQQSNSMYFLMEPLLSDPAFTASIDYRVESLQNIRTLVENGYAAAFVPARLAEVMHDCRVYRWYTHPTYDISFAASKYSGKKAQLAAVQQALAELFS